MYLNKYFFVRSKYNDKIYQRSKYIFLFGLVILLIINVSRFIGFYTLNDTDMTYLGILLMIPSVMLLICQFIIQPQITTLAELFKKKKVEILHISYIHLLPWLRFPNLFRRS